MADVSIDYNTVGQMVDGFQTAADTLHEVDRALGTAIAMLKATAFVGMVGNLALAHYLEGIQPNVARLATTCEEMNQDLKSAIDAMREADEAARQRFVPSDPFYDVKTRQKVKIDDKNVMKTTFTTR